MNLWSNFYTFHAVFWTTKLLVLQSRSRTILPENHSEICTSIFRFIKHKKSKHYTQPIDI